jgi:hypothetical protein
MRAFGNIIIPRWRHQLTPSTYPLGWSCLNSFDPMLFGIAIGAVRGLGESPKRRAIPTPALTSLSLNAAGLCLARGFEAEGKPGVVEQVAAWTVGAGVHHQGAKSRRQARRHRRRMMLASRKKVGDALGVTFSAGPKKREKAPTESARAGCSRSPTSCRPQWRSSLRVLQKDRRRIDSSRRALFEANRALSASSTAAKLDVRVAGSAGSCPKCDGLTQTRLHQIRKI